ncbi:MAG: ABC transporter ATP-binding protein [Myxococcota bacterium]
MTEPLLELADVHVELDSRAGRVHILRGVSLTVNRGESLSIVGPSGAGKSTMMMVIGGLERITRGSIRLAGREISSLNEDELAQFRQENVGIVFQAFRLIPTMTALENAALPLELAGKSDAEAEAKAALEAVGLGHRLDHYPDQLSGGEQQRVAMARAFVVKPPILLADEPTGNLDSKTGESVIELMFDLKDRFQTALVLITHDHGLAARCDRIVEMNDGLLSERTKGPRLESVGEG